MINKVDHWTVQRSNAALYFIGETISYLIVVFYGKARIWKLYPRYFKIAINFNSLKGRSKTKMRF